MPPRPPSDVAQHVRRTTAALTTAAVENAGPQLREFVPWAATRRVVAALVHARLRAAGVEEPSTLLTNDGLDAGQVAAVRTVPPPPPWPAGLAAPTLAELAALYPDLLSATSRKQTGAWFTDARLAGPTAARALAPLLAAAPARLRICDPAVGGGAFLLAALHELVAAGVPAVIAAEHCLFGVDFDPTAAALAALAVWEAAGKDASIEAIGRNIHRGDGLHDLLDGSFDAVVGNPPWETLQGERGPSASTPPQHPRQQELFAAMVDTGDGPERSRHDGAHRAALRRQFRHLGVGKLYTYRLFLERALRLLRPGGRLGMLMPAGLYFDRDASQLRACLLRECRWEWLFGFENKQRLFAIDSRYRFAAIVVEKGGSTDAVRTAFLRTDPGDWAAARPEHLLYRSEDVARLSPAHGTFVEIRSERDLAILRQMGAAGTPLLGKGAPFDWRQGDFNMTADAPQFAERRAVEASGCHRTDDGVWRDPGNDGLLLPLYQGAMIDDLHPNAAAHAGDTRRGTLWEEPRGATDLRPRFLVRATDWRMNGPPARLVLRALSNATNARTAVPCLLGHVPCGNSLGVFTVKAPGLLPVQTLAFGAGVLSSFVFDWALRQRQAGTNLNRFVLADTTMPRHRDDLAEAIARLVLRLCAVLPWHAPIWAAARAEGWLPAGWNLDAQRILAPVLRRQARADLELLVASAYGLGRDELSWILRDCDLPAAHLRDRSRTARLDPKGFWRVDRALPPEARLPALVLARYPSSSARR